MSKVGKIKGGGQGMNIFCKMGDGFERFKGPLTDFSMLALRVAFGLGLLMNHGWPKLMNFFAMAPSFPDPLHLGSPTISFGLVVFAEFFCSLFVILGVFTRWACIPVLIMMNTAFFVFHAQDPFAKKELAFLYSIGFLTIFLIGGGKFSLGRLFCRR